MRIRSQLLIATVAAVVVTALIAVGLAYVTRHAQASTDEQAESRQVARDVANMLSLTTEVAVFGGERSALQWRARLDQLRGTVASAVQRRQPASAELLELQRNIDDLPQLFDKFRQAQQEPATALSARRRELLLERLVAETQEVGESRYRWSTAVAEEQRREQRQYTAMVVAAPVALLVLLASLGVLVARRVLVPLARLQRAAAAIQSGDLGTRCATHAQDELGEASRAVDAMALALQQRSAALRASEHRLRLVADNLPALVAHIDADERYTFVNAHFGRKQAGEQAGDRGVDPQALLGRTVREVLGEAPYALLAPHLAAARRGDTVEFEQCTTAGGVERHHQSTYVPDIDATGTVQGCYVMTFDITARKQAELRQAASERWLQEVTDSMPALVAYIDLNHCYRFANARYLEWLGIAPADMIGRSIAQALGQPTYDTVRPNIERALAGERVQWTGQRRREGRLVYYLAEYIPDRGPDGRVRGCYALTVDNTERREAELKVARGEQRLLDLMNSLPAMVAYFDMAQHCQYANDTALRSQGLNRADVPGIPLRAALGEMHYAQHEPYVREALLGRRSRLESRIPFKGRDAHFQSHLIPDRVDGGAQRGFYLMTFDVTALKEAQQKQARIERQLRAITDNLPVLIGYVDRDERYAFLNATFEAWMGIDPASVIGQRVADVIPPANYAERRGYLVRALAGERVEFHLESQTGAVARSLQNIYIPDIQPDGSVSGIYTLSTDVTVMKDAERQLSELARIDPLTGLPNRRQLEERVHEAAARTTRSGQPMALMFLDVDHFKRINDTQGHAGGDAVLKEFAARLRASVRITDTVARLAGDEFVILLEGISGAREADIVAQKVLAGVRQPFVLATGSVCVTTSLGVAFCDRPAAPAELLERADAALYDAKAAGRNTYRLRGMDAQCPLEGTPQAGVAVADPAD